MAAFIHGSISREIFCLRDAANVGLATQGLSGTTQQQQQQQPRSIFSASEAIVPWFELIMALAASQMASQAASFLLRALPSIQDLPKEQHLQAAGKKGTRAAALVNVQVDLCFHQGHKRPRSLRSQDRLYIWPSADQAQQGRSHPKAASGPRANAIERVYEQVLARLAQRSVM